MLGGERMHWSEALRADEPVSGLIGRCLAGESVAYDALYDSYAPYLYRLAYSLLQNRQDAEEVLQDSFEYAFRRLDRYDPARSQLKTWLYRIVVSRCRNKRRRKWLPTLSLNHELAADPPDTTTPTPDEQMRLTERQQEVWRALGQLSPKLRETAVLRYYGDMPYKEIGQVLGIHPKTAESRMRLAHRALRVLLSDDAL